MNLCHTELSLKIYTKQLRLTVEVYKLCFIIGSDSSGFLTYLLQISEFLLKLPLLSFGLGQSLSLLTCLLLQARNTPCKTKTQPS